MLRRVLLGLMLLIVSLGSAPHRGTRRLPSGNHAALVVRFENGYYVARRVGFAEPLISGMELLQNSGLEVLDQHGLVCKIGPLGCQYPDEPCICQQEYWTYWHWGDGQWTYSRVGAAGYMVEPGAIDGWSWGAGEAPPEIEADSLFDTTRIMPGVPRVTSDEGAIAVQVAFQGDENNNASVSVRYRASGNSWSSQAVTLTRGVSEYRGPIAERLDGGIYGIRLAYVDPDGVTGSETWVITTSVHISHRLYLPALVKS